MTSPGTKILEDILTLSDFQQLLSDEQFVDFFNKFTCLPAFPQLVQITKKECGFLLHPPLPNAYIINSKGLVEWLWRKRLTFFVKSKLFREYRLCNILLNYSLVRRGEYYETETTKYIKDSLKWLQKRALGRVSKLRKFRKFLRNTEDGLKLYIYWLEAERLYFHIKLRSRAAIDVFKSIKGKYFIGEGRRRMPQHLLEEAFDSLPPYHYNRGIVSDAVCYDVTFAMCLQKICITRMQRYWLPRYLLEQRGIAVENEERGMLKTALKYLRGIINLDAQQQAAVDQVLPLGSNSKNSNDCAEDLNLRGNASNKDTNKRKESSSDDNEYYVARKLQLPKQKRTHKLFIKDQHVKSSAKNNGRNRSDPVDSDSSSDDEETCRRRIRSMKESSRNRKARRNQQRSSSQSRRKYGSDSEYDADSDAVDGRTDTRLPNSSAVKLKRTDDRRSRALNRRKLNYENLFSESDQLQKPTTPMEKLERLYKDIDDRRQHLFGAYDEKLTSTRSRPRTYYVDGGDKIPGTPAGPNLVKFALKHTGHSASAAVTQHRNSIHDSADTPHDLFYRGNTWDQSEEDFTRRLSEKHLDLSSSVESMRLSRKAQRGGAGPSRVEELSASPNMKRRKSSPKVKPKKHSAAAVATKVTFSLAGAPSAAPPPIKPARGSDSARERRHARAEKTKKRTHHRSENKTTLPDITQHKSLVALEEYTVEKDNAYRQSSEHARMILALQSDKCASEPFRTYLFSSDNGDVVSYLNFWLDVEKCRHDFQYGMMSFDSFLQCMHEIVLIYLVPSSPNHIDTPERLREQAIMCCAAPEFREMPWQMRELQKEAMEELKTVYQDFREQEFMSFVTAAAIRRKERPRRKPRGTALFPSLVGDDSRVRITRHDPDPGLDRVSKQLCARMTRALEYVIESSLPDGRESVCTIRSEIESDNDGNVEVPSTPVDIVERPTDYKELASQSARQYPGQKSNLATYIMPVKKSKRQPQAVPHETPKKVRPAIERPVYRPKNFQDILEDHAHLHFFNRFLKSHRADVPLRFWNAVERLSRTEKLRLRQIQARRIINKYFHSPKTPATQLLQCGADVIREISKKECVPTNRLYVAQTAVEHDLEEKWFEKYAATFLELPSYNSKHDVVAEVNDDTILQRNRKLRGICSVLRVFIKRAGSFMRNMKNPRMFEKFEKFLQRETEGETPASKSEMPIDVFDNRSDSTLSPVLYLRRDWDARVKQRIVNGRLITYNFLVNDLHFWRDVECYRKLVHEFSNELDVSPDAIRENTLLVNKARLIVSCYLESDVLPKVRINIPHEVARISSDALRNDNIEYGLFHKATITIFPMLLDFWRRFCAEHYAYIPTLSKKHQKIYGYKMTPAIAEQRKKPKKPRAPEEGGDSKRSTANANISSKYLNMDQTNFTMKRASPIGFEEMGLRLTFSVRHGVTLIQPSLRKRLLTENPASFADHDEARG